MQKRNLPLVKLPSSVDLTLYLIREELKLTRLFSALESAGFSDCSFHPYLGNAILRQLGAGPVPDDLFEWVNDLFEKHAHEIDAEMESQTHHALAVYHALESELQRRLGDASQRCHGRTE